MFYTKVFEYNNFFGIEIQAKGIQLKFTTKIFEMKIGLFKAQ